MSAADNVGNSHYFLNSFLSKPISNIPKGAQWAVQFGDLEAEILPAIEQAYKREPNQWDTSAAAKAVLTSEYQNVKGCMFCQAISVQGEGANVSPGGSLQQNALLRSYVGGGRQDMQKMRMSFLDTNISFCDSFLRGWALATANFGMVARYDVNYRTWLTCWKFGITPTGPIVLQTVTFYGVCCVEVSSEEYNYDPPSSYVRREAQFVYHSYSVNSNPDESLVSSTTSPKKTPPKADTRLTQSAPFGQEQMDKVRYLG